MVYMNFIVIFVGMALKHCSAKCAGGFDIYFILDKSVSLTLDDFQVQTVNFVSDMVEKLNSPMTRISVITFSDEASLDLPLTRDRGKIKENLNKLKTIVPYGKTYLGKGIDIAIDQVKSKGTRSASVAIILTDGVVSGRNAFVKAAFLRNQLSVIVYAIGVAGYTINELQKVVSEPVAEHVFTATNYHTLHAITDKVIDTACIEVTDVKPRSVCVGIPYVVTLYGKGFTKTVGHSNISCNFRYNDTIDFVVKPSEMTDDMLKCRAPILQSAESYVSLQVAFTRNKYISSDIRVVADSCVIPDYTTPILIGLLVLITMGLMALWWFFPLLPCVTPWTIPHATPVAAPVLTPEPISKKWPTVDASFYGGGGVGGIKPVRVKWGEKGATDTGNKLTQTPDANVINPGDDVVDGKDRLLSTTDTRPSVSQRLIAVLQRIKRSFIDVGIFFFVSYLKCASIRPQRNGKSGFYSNSLERKTMLG